MSYVMQGDATWVVGGRVCGGEVGEGGGGV